MPAIIHPLGTPLAYELDFAPPFEPTICFESQQHVMTPPTLSVLETQILTASTYPYTELFRSTFINSCTTSTWNVSIARTVLWYANSVSISNILNDLYPGLNPNTGILCLRQRTTYIDAALQGLYPAYQLFLDELSERADSYSTSKSFVTICDTVGVSCLQDLWYSCVSSFVCHLDFAWLVVLV